MERNTDYNERIYLNANVARNIKKGRRAAWRPGLAHHTSSKGEPAERGRKRLPLALFEHTTSPACVRQQHPGWNPQWSRVMVDLPGETSAAFWTNPVVPHCP